MANRVLSESDAALLDALAYFRACEDLADGRRGDRVHSDGSEQAMYEQARWRCEVARARVEDAYPWYAGTWKPIPECGSTVSTT